MIARISPVLLACALAACVSEVSSPSPVSQPPAKASEAKAFTNADALSTYQKLGLVKGAPASLPETSAFAIADPEHVFADAIAYGTETQSYTLLVWWKGALVLEHYYPGYSDEVRAEPASMHKSLLGLVTAKALEDGYIESPDTPVSKYIEEWQDDPRGDVTVRQLLTMTSGLAPLSYEGGDAAPARQFMAGTLDARATLLGLQLEQSDKQHFHYINTVSQLLLMVVETAVGQPYAEYLAQNIWQPIGADDAYVYYFEDGGFPRGYASFLARPVDWLRLGLLVKDEGRFDGKQVIDADLMHELKSPSPFNPNYGWQIWRGETWEQDRFYNDEKAGFSVTQSEPYLVDDLVFFDGFGGQRVITSQSEDLVIVRLGNTSVTWDDAQLPNRVISALNKLDVE